MPVCGTCGQIAPRLGRFCTSCGTALESQNASDLAWLFPLISGLIEPIDLALASDQESGAAPQTSIDLIHIDLMRVAIQIAKSDGRISSDEGAIYGDIARLLEPKMATLDAEKFASHLRSFTPEEIGRLSEDNPPFIFAYLEAFDRAYGTDHTEKARGMLFRFANCIAMADGTISPPEEKALAEVKRVLFPTSNNNLGQ